MNNVGNFTFEKEINHSDIFQSKYVNDGSDLISGYSLSTKRNLLISDIQNINSSLNGICQQRMGNIVSGQIRQIQKTIELVNTLVSKRHKDLQTKNEYLQMNRKLQVQRSNLTSQVEKLTKQKKSWLLEKENNKVKMSDSEKYFKETIDKITKQKIEVEKQFTGIANQQVHIKKQIQRKDMQISRLQTAIKKHQQKNNFKNSFQIFQQVQANGPQIYHTNADHQFNNLVNLNIQKTYSAIRQQNQYYKDCLIGIYKQIHSVLEFKRQTLRRRKGYQSSDFQNSFDLNIFKPQILSLPPKQSEEGFRLLSQNIAKFKDAIRLGDSDTKNEDQKITCVQNVKSLFRNYKNVIQNQDQLLNKVILKAKQFKNNEMAYIQNKLSKNIDDQELQKAQRFIEEQNQYLSSKNRELEVTRKAMQATMRRAQEDRNQMIRRKNQQQEEIIRVRKNIQLLPAFIQEQLNRK